MGRDGQAATEPCPPEVVEEVAGLSQALDQAIPPKRLDKNLLIGTWNIRAFGGVTDKWHAGPRDQPKRDLRALAHITEIVSRFDVMAIQEVKGDIGGLRRMMKDLGPDWAFVLTDVTQGKAGNDERLAFVFDLRRVRPAGLACELVISEEQTHVRGTSDLVRQFARTPYAVSFLSAGQTFLLVTLHVLWGTVPADRIPELRGIAQWIARWSDELASWGHNLIALGDFNIDRKDDEAFKAFTSTGLRAPKELDAVPRTIFGDAQGFYDQIAWFTGDKGAPRLNLVYTGHAGGFDFVPHVFRELDPQQVSWRMSDHMPLWCEFAVRRPGALAATAATPAVRTAARAGE